MGDLILGVEAGVDASFSFFHGEEVEKIKLFRMKKRSTRNEREKIGDRKSL